MTSTDEDRLDHAHIGRAAQWAARGLRDRRVARVILTPGDMTRYPILIAAPWWEFTERPGHNTQQLGHDYWVALCAPYGGGYPWNGQDVHWLYAAEKWAVNDPSAGSTGRVLAAFLNALSSELTS